MAATLVATAGLVGIAQFSSNLPREACPRENPTADGMTYTYKGSCSRYVTYTLVWGTLWCGVTATGRALAGVPHRAVLHNLSEAILG